jgi:hypothetical protein
LQQLCDRPVDLLGDALFAKGAAAELTSADKAGALLEFDCGG